MHNTVNTQFDRMFGKNGYTALYCGQGAKKVSHALSFTKQMAALYNKTSWPGQDVVLEFSYTDV